ncbi:MAG: ATP-binding protein [Candidatus Zixiibacteriota bacterium]
MASSSELIHQYFHVRQSTRINRIVGQIDTVAKLLLKLFSCDFAAIFYRRSDSEDLVPAAFQGWDDRGVAELRELESAYQGATGARKASRRGIFHLNDRSGAADETDRFAVANGLVTRFQYPIYVGGNLRAVIVAYWKTRPENNLTNVSYIITPLSEVLLGWMALIEEIHVSDNFSLRLSALISLFDLPLDEYKVSELVVRMLRTVRTVLPGASILLVTRDIVTGQYTTTDPIGGSPLPKDLYDDLQDECKALLEGLRKRKVTTRGWHDLSHRFNKYRREVMAIELYGDEQYQYGAAFVRDDEISFAEAEIELISLVRMFCRSIINNALLVRGLRKHNERIKETSVRLADAETMATLADMSSGIAHDLNNVIGSIVGRLQLLKMKCPDEATVDSLGKIEATALEAATTISRLQQFSTSVKARKLDTIDLVSCVRGYFDCHDHVWSDLALGKRVTVTCSIETAEARVDGSSEDLTTVLDKLVQNAVEFAPDQSSVRVTLTENDRVFHLSVIDAGPGVPDGIRSKIFYPFFTTKSIRGAGLGLAIVHGVITRWGGKVTVDSDAGVGSVFRITLQKTGAADAVSDSTSKTRITRPLRVLVVDDDEQIRGILADMLDLEGHTTVGCADGYSALKQLKGEKYDILITDLGMPGMSGLELAGAAHQAHPKMPIAMITGWGTQLNEEEIAHKGVKAVVPKPFHLKDVKALVYELTHERSRELESQNI